MSIRDAVISGEYVKRLNLSDRSRWTDEMLRASMHASLAKRPAGQEEVWVFAYGSLIWNPMIAHDAKERATLLGWRRSFCIRDVAGRGSPEKPGRMLSLERGGSTRGVAFRLPAEQLDHELHLLWTREMITGAYRPEWIELQLDSGRKITALAFTANPASEIHEIDSSVSQVGPIIADALGSFGRNNEYLYSLAACLARIGIHDDYIDELVTRTLVASHQTGSANLSPK